MRRPLVPALLALVVLLIPGIVRADNCGSLSDCYGVITAAAIAVAAIAIILALIFLAPGILGLGAVEVAGEAAAFEGFSVVESGVIREAAAILSDPAWAEIEAAAESGVETLVEIGGRPIQFVPNAPPGFFAMTNFEEGGFAIFNNAFAAGEEEVGKTVLWELQRLATSASAEGVGGELAASETAAAQAFAERAWQVLQGLLQ